MEYRQVGARVVGPQPNLGSGCRTTQPLRLVVRHRPFKPGEKRKDQLPFKAAIVFLPKFKCVQFIYLICVIQFSNTKW